MPKTKIQKGKKKAEKVESTTPPYTIKKPEPTAPKAAKKPPTEEEKPGTSGTSQPKKLDFTKGKF